MTLEMPTRLIQPPTTDLQLWLLIRELWGLEIPNTQVCEDHSTPFRAIADAYFARQPVQVWKASRGLAGKTFALAVLVLTESVTTPHCRSALLGGSLFQSQLAQEYTDEFWEWETEPGHMPPRRAPKEMLDSSLIKETKLTNQARISVLPASTKSVRGPHPQKLRMDEADEMKQFVLTSALGQPMEKRGIDTNVVIASTFHYANGTFAYVLKEAAAKGWPVHEWCYRESHALGTGWLSQKQIDITRGSVPQNMWEVEYELGEPSIEGRAIASDSVEAMFDKSLGDVNGDIGVEYEFEDPEDGVPYATAADWAKQQDFTVVATFRMDVSPWRCVAWQRINRQKWQIMVGIFNDRVRRYPPAPGNKRRKIPPSLRHDATGLGTVVADLLDLPVPDDDGIHISMVGQARQELFNEYIGALESTRGKDDDGEPIPAPAVIYPMIKFAYAEHLFCTVEDLTKSTGHPPDSFVAGALAWACRQVAPATPIASPTGPRRAAGTGWRRS